MNDSLYRKYVDADNCCITIDDFTPFKFENIITKDNEMKRIVALAKKVAKSEASVLLYGPSGSGKEVMAEFIHNTSGRLNEPFIKINCAAIPESLFESEIFGYESGAFTGASKFGKKGVMELAEGGTLFLDEIGEMPLSFQAKLLRIIQDGKFLKIGGQRELKVNIRLISATNKDLKKMVEEGTFREDLFFRLNVIPISLPDLKGRKEDIIILALYFLNNYNKKYNMEKRLSKGVIEEFLCNSWPGNVRELKNIIERLVLISMDNIIQTNDLMYSKVDKIKSGKKDLTIDLDYDEDKSLKEMVNEYEKNVILKTLKKYGSIRKTAEILKVNPSTISRKLKAYNY